MLRTVIPVLLVLVGALTGCAAETPTSPAGDASASGDATECGESTDPTAMPSVTLTDGTGGLEVAWMTAGTNDAQESVLWALVVQDVAYEAAYQVGVKVTGGTPTVFVFDQLAGPQENLTVTPEITDDGATVVVPWDALPGLEVGAIEWRAALNLDGADVAVCPLPGDDVLAPAKVTLNRD